MRWIWVGAMALLTAGCQTVDRSVDVLMEADHQARGVTMTCRGSSSGTCHALFVTGDAVERISAAVGTKASATGIGPETRFCIDVAEPANGCTLRPLAHGQQIVKSQSTHS